METNGKWTQQTLTSRKIASNTKAPFIVDINASLLKKNTQHSLSKQARVLYPTMRISRWENGRVEDQRPLPEGKSN
jgi:hypothetical protein